jgi:hypothetical protein
LDISFLFYLWFIPSTLKAFLKAEVRLWPWWPPLHAAVCQFFLTVFTPVFVEQKMHFQM